MELPTFINELHEQIGILIIVVGGVFAYAFMQAKSPFLFLMWELSPSYWLVLPLIGFLIYIKIWERVSEHFVTRKPFEEAKREWVKSDAYRNGALKLFDGLASFLPGHEPIGDTMWGCYAWIAGSMGKPFHLILDAPSTGPVVLFRARPSEPTGYMKERAKQLNFLPRYGGKAKSKLDEELERYEALSDMDDDEREVAERVMNNTRSGTVKKKRVVRADE